VRVLQVIQELGVGGAERVVQALVRGAGSAGHECAVVAASGPVAADLGVHRYELPLLERQPWRVPGAALAVDRALRAFRPDVVHCHNPGVSVPVALATLRGRRVPTLVSVHGVPDADYGPAARLLRLGGLPTISCGPGVTAGLEEAGLPVTETIVNGVAPAPPPADRSVFADELGIDPARPVVLVVGRLSPVKNPALALRAVAHLPDTALVFVGDGPLRTELLAAVRDAGLEDRVVLAGLRSDARELIGAADAIALTSHSEGLPLAALEALAAGKPLVATAVRGVRELLHDGVDSLLVPPDDSDALTRALERVLNDEQLAARLGEQGRLLAARYSQAAMVERFLQLYGETARR
jgi:glycosyltransferase involved in cell wall biosynthesis